MSKEYVKFELLGSSGQKVQIHGGRKFRRCLDKLVRVVVSSGCHIYICAAVNSFSSRSKVCQIFLFYSLQKGHGQRKMLPIEDM